MKKLLFSLALAASLSAAPCANCTITGATDYRIPNNKSPDAAMSFGPKMSFTIPVENGIYEVGLRFMEPNQTWRVGGRIMNVTINDQPILWNFDAYAAAGTNPVERPVLISVTGGKIVVVLTSVVKDGNAILSGIWVQPREFFPAPVLSANVPASRAGFVFWPDGTRKTPAKTTVPRKMIPAGFWPDGTRKTARR